MHFLIPEAWAAGSGASSAANQGSFMPMLLILIVFIAGFYFFIMRPQQKRQKQHRDMISQLGTGDEIVTNGGMLGKVTELGDQYIGIEVAKGVEIRIQKNAIGAVLPKGTIKHG